MGYRWRSGEHARVGGKAQARRRFRREAVAQRRITARGRGKGQRANVRASREGLVIHIRVAEHRRQVRGRRPGADRVRRRAAHCGIARAGHGANADGIGGVMAKARHCVAQRVRVSTLVLAWRDEEIAGAAVAAHVPAADAGV